MTYQDHKTPGQSFASLPSRAGDAHHTLVAGPLAEMIDMLIEQTPPCTSTALTLLRGRFPEHPVEEHTEALRIYRERLSAPGP